jgi:hypothetical protein
MYGGRDVPRTARWYSPAVVHVKAGHSAYKLGYRRVKRSVAGSGARAIDVELNRLVFLSMGNWSLENAAKISTVQGRFLKIKNPD